MNRIVPLILALAVALGCAAFPPDPDRAAESLAGVRKAAAQGDAEALFKLGMLYDRGYDSILPDTARANEYYARAAAGGYAPAMGLLGFRLIRGEGIAADSARGVEMLRRGADMGDARALNNLGWWLTFRPGASAAERGEGLRCLRRAADAGHPVALASLGRAEEEGISGRPNPGRAAELYDSALSRGFSQAAAPLWRLRQESFAALQPDSALRLGRAYYLGAAPELGVALLEIAAGKGSADAMALLGDAAAKARGRAYNHTDAVRFYYLAARAGCAPAQFILAELLESFPDALDDIVDNDAAPASYDTTADAAPVPHADASYWRYRARIGGVVSAAEAEKLLYNGRTPR